MVVLHRVGDEGQHTGPAKLMAMFASFQTQAGLEIYPQAPEQDGVRPGHLEYGDPLAIRLEHLL